MLRVISRSLILWDNVRPTSDWIEEQIPEMVKRAFDRMISQAKNMAGFAGLASFANMRVNSSPRANSAVYGAIAGRRRADGDSDEENNSRNFTDCILCSEGEGQS